MAERPEDLNLPVTVVQRIIKEALPDGVIVSKEARQTISRASSVFVLYLTACAVTHANKAKRKTLAVNDIISAITDMEFEQFIQPLNEALKSRKDTVASVAAAKKTTKVAANKATVNEEEDDVDEADAEEEEHVEEKDEADQDETEQNTSQKPVEEISHAKKKPKLNHNKENENSAQGETEATNNDNENEANDEEEASSESQSENEIDY